jgi:hypothetical protein
VIDPFRRLDAVEEFLVAHGVAEVGERFGDGERTGRIAPGDARGPGIDPGPGGHRPFGRGQEVAGSQPIKHRVAEMSVRPVHDDGRAAVAAPVTGVEVAVRDGVGQAALVQLRKPAQQPARRRRLAGAELTGDLAVE